MSTTQKSCVVGDLLNGAIPGYQGHVPGKRIEVSTCGHRFSQGVQAGRASRSVATLDAQATRQDMAAATKTIRLPPDAGGAEVPYQARIGLMSRIYDQPDCPEARRLPRGSATAAGSLPGCTVHVPGKKAQNVFGEGWSKANVRSLGEHVRARKASRHVQRYDMGPSLEGVQEPSLFDSSYQGSTRGWSTCAYTGVQIGAAGAPAGRVQATGLSPPAMAKSIPGYSGWVPCRYGDNVFGVRQRECAEIAGTLKNNSRMTTVQR